MANKPLVLNMLYSMNQGTVLEYRGHRYAIEGDIFGVVMTHENGDEYVYGVDMNYQAMCKMAEEIGYDKLFIASCETVLKDLHG
jgi:hypothetical protein